MSDAAGKAKARSVHDRLLNLARAQRRSFDLLVHRYAIERMLYRIARSPHAERFILKGAMVFLTWGVELRRPTRDLDLMGFVPPNPEHLAAIFNEIAGISVEEDGLVFDGARIIAERIREEDVYAGVRVKLPALLGSMRINLQIDIGVGDALVPEPKITEFPTLLGNDPPMLRSYSPYLVVAEKYEAMVKLGEANSRMKDFFDLWILSAMFEFDEELLRQAIVHTFDRRGTSLPTTRPIALSDTFYGSPSKQLQWRAFILKSRITESVPELRVVCDLIWQQVSEP